MSIFELVFFPGKNDFYMPVHGRRARVARAAFGVFHVSACSRSTCMGLRMPEPLSFEELTCRDEHLGVEFYSAIAVIFSIFAMDAPLRGRDLRVSRIMDMTPAESSYFLVLLVSKADQ